VSSPKKITHVPTARPKVVVRQAYHDRNIPVVDPESLENSRFEPIKTVRPEPVFRQAHYDRKVPVVGSEFREDSRFEPIKAVRPEPVEGLNTPQNSLIGGCAKP
jgi:hypothetical protein